MREGAAKEIHKQIQGEKGAIISRGQWITKAMVQVELYEVCWEYKGRVSGSTMGSMTTSPLSKVGYEEVTNMMNNQMSTITFLELEC